MIDQWADTTDEGECYFQGVAGERFAVRNSGAVAVVEGAGDVRVNGLYHAQPRLPPASAPGTVAARGSGGRA